MPGTSATHSAPPPPGAEPVRLLPGDGSAVRLRAVAGVAGAATGDDERAEIVAEDLDGRVLGRAGYARVYGPRAVVTLEVADGLWRGGLPEALLASLCRRAARAGISTLLARVGPRETQLRALLREHLGARVWASGEYVDVELSTAPPPSRA